MTDTAIYAIVAGAFLLVLVVLYFSNKTNSKFQAAFPPGTLDLIEKLLTAQMDRFLQAGLKSSGSTPSQVDDQFFITALELRGWTVTGSADTGYTLTPPPVQVPPPPSTPSA